MSTARCATSSSAPSGVDFEAWLARQAPGGRQTALAWWEDPAYNGAAQPVVGICWHEARACCAWLSAQIRQILRLCHAALCKCGQRTLAEPDMIGFAAAKDRKSNATFGSVFDSVGLSQSPISHQEVLGAAIKPPKRTPSAACSPDRSRWRRLFGLQARVIPDERGSSCLILFWRLPGPTRRCAGRTRPPVRAGRLDPTEDRSPPALPLPPPTAVAGAQGRCGVAGTAVMDR